MADEKQTNKIEKSTIYQQLNKLMNLDGFGFQDNQPTTVMQQQASTFPQEKSKIIIKGNSPEEIHKKGLELEQKRELQNKFFRTTDRGFQKALQYEASRLQMYIDFEGMEYYPIISSALDLFMEEATTIGLNGKMLNIYSNKERIKMLLEEFFYDTVNVNVNLPFWVRNTPIKYDSIIPLLNGESITIKELSERLKKNPDEEIWTYSIQDKTNKIVAGKVIWCDLTRKDSDILRVTFDDGTYIETTPDHEYMLRNGSYLRADELNIGASLMPFYTLTSYISGYEKVYNPASNHHVFTHRIVAQECAEENFVNDYAETSSILNHNVISVEKINEKYDVYCMEVVGKNNEQDRHNFPVCSKDENGEYTRNGVFLSNCKYGDNFVLLYGERKKGITHVKQMVNYEIERFERIQDGKPLVKFKERMTGDEFNVFEIAHFRLLGDDKFLPYGSCLLSDSYIKTSNGIKEIKNIVRGDVVIGFDVNTQKKIESNVLDVVCNGEKQTFKISTQHNYIKATDNHKILIYDYRDNTFKYKLVAELMIGDELIINNNDDYNELIKIDKSFEVREHKNRVYDDFTDDIKYVPDYVDEDFAKIFGFLLGDGNITTKRPYMVYFAYGMHETINRKYIQLLEKLSNKNIYLRKNKDYTNGIASAVVNSKSLVTILKNMGFEGNSHTKRIPKWLFSTSKNIRKAFLEGIHDADGCVFVDKWNCKRFQIEMANYSLINDIKLLAQSLGYKTGSINKRKKRENVIIKGIKVINVADSFVLYFYESENNQKKSSEIKNRLTNDFIIEKIKSIEKDEIGFVYDIYVDNENHNFYANNIVVHNSVLNKVRRVFRQLCLDANTNIWTPNGYTKIKDLKVNDLVYSYDYNQNKPIISKIKNVFKTGEKERFGIRTRHRELILTDTHPLLTKDNDDNYQYKNIKEITNEKLILPTINDGLDSFKIKLDSKDYYVLLNESGKAKIKNIQSNGIISKLRELNCQTSIKNLHSFIKGYNRSVKYDDYLKLCGAFNLTLDDIDLYYFNSRNKAIVNKELEFIVDQNFVQFFGFMLGDGWINYYNKTIGFALGVYDIENEFYINLCKSIGDFKYHITEANIIRGGQVNFYSKELMGIFEKLNFKTGAFNKIIPQWVFSLSYDNKMKFIRGMFDADGCDSNGLYSSSNYELINNLRILAQTCNIKVGKILNYKVSSVFKSKFINVEVNRKPTYSLYVHLNEIDSKSQFIEEKIISIQPLGIKEVWDIEVDNDLHNFIAEGLVVHNCLAEDAMLTYRIIRAGEKKVFKIDVGNIDEDDIEEYIYKVATKFKKTSQVNPNDGQIDYRFNILGNDEDYFIPVRNANTQTGIDTLPGATNLDAIQDIEYLRDNLFMGLGIPKPFLSMQDAAGGGKNMAQHDIRFSKKINRIQQAMIQELNKMAMIHLYLLGYSGEDLNGFTLTLTNPSTQQELLKSELMRDKAQTYTELTRAEGGIAAMSHTTAKRMIFNMSDREIVDDLKQQKMEKVVMQELQDSPVTIKKSGLFTDIDKRFGSPEEEGMPTSGATTPENSLPPSGGAPDSGMSPTPTGGAPASTPAPMGGQPSAGNASGAPASGGEPMMENKKLTDEEYDSHVKKLVYGSSNETEIKNETVRAQIIQENNEINDSLNNKAMNMINEIDSLLENHESINTRQKIVEIKNDEIVDFDNIELID